MSEVSPRFFPQCLFLLAHLVHPSKPRLWSCSVEALPSNLVRLLDPVVDDI